MHGMEQTVPDHNNNAHNTGIDEGGKSRLLQSDREGTRHFVGPDAVYAFILVFLVSFPVDISLSVSSFRL